MSFRRRTNKGDGSAAEENKKKAFNEVYNLDIDTLLIQTKRSYEAAKILKKEQKNIHRKREKDSNRFLSKCMDNYDKHLKELHELQEAAALVEQHLKNRQREIRKSTSERGRRHLKQQSESSPGFPVIEHKRNEKSDSAERNAPEELEQKVKSLEKEAERLQHELQAEQTEKDNVFKKETFDDGNQLVTGKLLVKTIRFYEAKIAKILKREQKCIQCTRQQKMDDEQVYFIRIVFLILDGGKMVCKGILYKELNDTGVSLEQILKEKEERLKNKVLRKQHSLLFPRNDRVKQEDFDLSLLIVVLLDVMNMPEEIRNLIKTIKVNRDEIIHGGKVALTQATFESMKTSLTQLLSKLGESLSDDIQMELSQMIQKYLVEPFGGQTALRYVDRIQKDEE